MILVPFSISVFFCYSWVGCDCVAGTLSWHEQILTPNAQHLKRLVASLWSVTHQELRQEGR